MVSKMESKGMRSFWEFDLAELTETGMRVSVVISSFFNASHQVMNPEGVYGNLHQHSFHLRVTVVGRRDVGGFILPFYEIRQILQRISSIYEGKILNELPPFEGFPPTLENLAIVISAQVKKMTMSMPVRLIEVELLESPTVGVRIEYG